MRCPDQRINPLWRGFQGSMPMPQRSSQSVSPAPRGDYAQPALHEMDAYFYGSRPMYPGLQFDYRRFYSSQFPRDILAYMQSPGISNFIREQELRHNQQYKKDDMMMPLVVEPRNRQKYTGLNSGRPTSSFSMIPTMK